MPQIYIKQPVLLFPQSNILASRNISLSLYNYPFKDTKLLLPHLRKNIVKGAILLFLQKFNCLTWILVWRCRRQVCLFWMSAFFRAFWSDCSEWAKEASLYSYILITSVRAQSLNWNRKQKMCGVITLSQGMLWTGVLTLFITQ